MQILSIVASLFHCELRNIESVFARAVGAELMAARTERKHLATCFADEWQS